MIPDELRDVAQWIVGGLALIGIATKVTVIYQFLVATWMSLGSVFTLTTVGLLTLPPHIPPDSPTDWLILVIGGAFALKIANKIYENYKNTEETL